MNSRYVVKICLWIHNPEHHISTISTITAHVAYFAQFYPMQDPFFECRLTRTKTSPSCLNHHCSPMMYNQLNDIEGKVKWHECLHHTIHTIRTIQMIQTMHMRHSLCASFFYWPVTVTMCLKTQSVNKQWSSVYESVRHGLQRWMGRALSPRAAAAQSTKFATASTSRSIFSSPSEHSTQHGPLLPDVSTEFYKRALVWAMGFTCGIATLRKKKIKKKQKQKPCQLVTCSASPCIL